MNYWLVKSEPETYSWNDLVRDKKTGWDGVRNYQARNHMRTMKKGDRVFIYHSGDERSIIGIAQVAKEAYPDAKDQAWVAVDLVPEKKLVKPVSLTQVKADKNLTNMVLVKASRLSVQPVKREEFEYIEGLAMN
jgi:predicted RNA-binding protein with PUA-like domain